MSQPTNQRPISIKNTFIKKKVIFLFNSYNHFYQSLFWFKNNIWGEYFFIFIKDIEKLYLSFRETRDLSKVFLERIYLSGERRCQEGILKNIYITHINDGKEIGYIILDNLSVLIEIERSILVKLEKEKKLITIKKFIRSRNLENINTLHKFSTHLNSRN